MVRGSKRGTRRRRADEDYGWITRILLPTLSFFFQTAKTQDTHRLRNNWWDSKRQQHESQQHVHDLEEHYPQLVTPNIRQYSQSTPMFPLTVTSMDGMPQQLVCVICPLVKFPCGRHKVLALRAVFTRAM